MKIRCPKCATDNPDDVPRCLSCGEPLGMPSRDPDGVEIEIYDINASPELEPTAFEKVLAATRAGAEKNVEPALGNEDTDSFLRGEIEDGYKIRQRRKSYRTHTGRNLIITAAALAAVATGVYIVVRTTMDKLPKYDYAHPAFAGATDAALKLAADEESRPRPPAVDENAGFGLLFVVGEPGKVFVDGDYVGDAPLRDMKLPPGPRHILVKLRHVVVLDEAIEVRPGERYTFEPAGPALYTGLSRPPGTGP